MRPGVPVAQAVAHRTHVCTLFGYVPPEFVYRYRYRYMADPYVWRAKPDQTTVPLASAFIPLATVPLASPLPTRVRAFRRFHVVHMPLYITSCIQSFFSRAGLWPRFLLKSTNNPLCNFTVTAGIAQRIYSTFVFILNKSW